MKLEKFVKILIGNKLNGSNQMQNQWNVGGVDEN